MKALKKIGSVVLAVCAAASMISQSAGAATAHAAAGYRAYAKFGYCSTGTAYKVYLYLRGSASARPHASLGHYRLAKETTVNGVCTTTELDDREIVTSGATKFVVMPDMSSAELEGPSVLGTIHVVWTAAGPPAVGGDPTVTSTSPLIVSSGTFLERPQTARGTLGSVINNAGATRSSIESGAWETITG